MLGGKIHRATVTEANAEYEGSITVDAALLEAAGILPNEAVHVWNVTNGARLQTYALEGPRDSGVMCVNGGAAHHASPGDLIIVAAFVDLPDTIARDWQPKAVFVDGRNRIVEHRAEEPGRAAG
jgi:aspartate 1-decarboxylase